MTYGRRYIPMTYFDSLADARKQLRENSLLALELQVEMAEFMKSPRSIPTYQNFVRTYGSDRTKFGAEQDLEVRGVMLHHAVQEIIGSAPTYYVSPDMCEMVKMASEAMPSEGLKPTVIPSETGFIVFSKPFVVEGPGYDEDIEAIRITAVAWKQAQVLDSAGASIPGVSYFLFMHPHDSAVFYNHMNARDLKEKTGIDIVEPILEEQPNWFVTETEMRQNHGPLPIYDFSGWAYGRPWNHVAYTDPLGLATPTDIGGGVGAIIDGVQQVHPLVDQVRRQLLATWLMLTQTVTKLQTETPPRFLRRRANRFMAETGDVVIVRLRKEVSDGLKKAEDYEPDGEPWYTHRFLVKGHWKRQHYGPRNSESKLIWVSPYIKGDPSLPLVIKDRVYSLEG